ncbi:MAG: LuxR C-terminal-related transcriptional regulator [Anaerolineae bacterium]
MSLALLTTKLHVPAPRPNRVARPQLTARLDEGLDGKLTLVSAPAGFGKTSLISEWIAGRMASDPAARVAWLSLDEHDADVARFLTYLFAAVQPVAPAVTDRLLPLLEEAPRPVPTEALLTEFVNEIALTDEPLILVMDDYHLTDSRPVDEAVAFLIAHLPPRMHLVITTREDPALPLARLRARGHLTEVRAKDLRFQPAEAAEFLNRGMGLSLDVEDIAVLEDRTEGWVAGLQLAALSLQGQPDAPGFIQAFAGDHRYIVDYLAEEVLERQPTAIRDFLLRTAILDRLNGPLCEAVTGLPGGSERLEALERGNFFLIPLDDRRYWYRYHHLFADVLTAHLIAEQPDQVAALHRRASAWYAEHDMLAEAIRHALAGEDAEGAATLIEQAVPELRRTRQEATLLGWLRALPEDVLRRRPALSVHYAGVLLQIGQFDEVEARLRDAEWVLHAAASRGDSPDTTRQLGGWLAAYRAAFALTRDDVEDTLKYARQALEAAPEDDNLTRGAAESLQGLGYWRRGDLEAAHWGYTECMTRLLGIGYLPDAMGCALALADLEIEQGRLREAMRTYERALRLAESAQHPALRGTADMQVGLSALFYEHNDLPAAHQHLHISQELGELAGLPQNAYRWRVALARLRHAEGAADEAIELLHEAERHFHSDFSPVIHPLPALRARIWIAQGNLGEAFGWARERGLAADDDLSYLREFEHITLARALLAEYRIGHHDASLHDALRLLKRLLAAAEAGGRIGSVIELLLLQALAGQLRADLTAAIGSLKRALTLAAPQGYIRLFVDEGQPLARLLEQIASQGTGTGYAQQLLNAFQPGGDQPVTPRSGAGPLSERELGVLRLLASELTGPEIAQELMVSLNTLRTHTKNIYDKLGVHNRQAALHRAAELHLI